MFVNSINIKEFRGIKDCSKSIKFSNFTVLIGRNNSGKSTILEALSLLPNPTGNNYIYGKMSNLDLLKEIHRSDPSDPKNKRLLYLYSGISRLKYCIGYKEIIIELTQGNVRILSNAQELISPDIIIKYLNLEITPKKMSKLVAFIPYDISILDALEKKMKYLKDSITKRGYHIKLTKFLNECVNDEYSEIVFLEPISLRKVYLDNSAYIQLRDLGSGAEKVIKIMAILEIMEPKLVLIDDFESGLHPSLIKMFLKWLKEKDWQTIISTHSIDVLYHLAEIKPKDLTILLLKKSKEDIIYYEGLNLDELEDYLNANTDPRLLVDALKL